MKLLGSIKSKITKNVNGEKLTNLKITEVDLIHCNVANSDYERKSRILYTFVLNKSFGQFLDISLKSFISLKTFNSEFSSVKVWFNDQNSKLLYIEDALFSST